MYNKFGKRTLDIIIAGTALIVFALPMIIVALWVKLDSRGPALFRQLRYGKNLVPFTVYKFRTMTVDAPSDMPTNAFKDAGAHITRSGKIMRKLSLDELPQLFNVLKGEMSIVGPRPVVLKEVKLIEFRKHFNANNIKPGVTGWAQVNGRDTLSPGEKAELDGFYAERVSFWFDIKCILWTVWKVISVDGQQEGHEDKKSDFILDDTMSVAETD